ncbi:MAG: class I SAM-dependent methyltransferase, partial [Chloroflexi bacterium]|nr:class I SAM-dependent methyltransferase [Chloroflexota bacterium]
MIKTILKGWWLGIHRLRSLQDYQRLQIFLAEATVAELKAKGIDLSAASVLELGAGVGGYSLVLNRESRSFLATDMQKDLWLNGDEVPFQQVDVLRPFPFEDDSFDLVYCSSLIEHIPEAGNMLDESWRVLKPGGVLYLSFPPFYSLAMIGGHLFKPFHFLGERLA